MIKPRKILPFAATADNEEARVGRVHWDGSITFRGKTYPTIKDVPPELQGLRPDVEAHSQWRKLYRAVMPEPRRGR